MKQFLSILFLFSVLVIYGQKNIYNENNFVIDHFTLRITKAYILSYFQNSTSVFSKSKDLKRLLIKVKVESLDGNKEEFDINPFSLIDPITKTRVRPIDASFQEFTKYFSFNKLTIENNNKPGKYVPYSIDHSVHDRFLDYHFDGIENIESFINFGTKRKPDKRIIYYSPKKMRKRRIVLIFPVYKDISRFEFYYGNEKITNIDI